MIEKGANNWNHGLYGACLGGHNDLILFMIEKGANDWNWALCNACLRGYKDLALFMIEKGADIDNADPSLLDNDILYLIQRGVIKFGKYDKIEKMWREWLRIARMKLNGIMIPDLVSIVASY